MAAWSNTAKYAQLHSKGEYLIIYICNFFLKKKKE